jgi:hypothetical protein
MLSHLGAGPPSKGCLDASHVADQTRYHHDRPDNTGGAGASRLSGRETPARCGRSHEELPTSDDAKSGGCPGFGPVDLKPPY